MSGQSIAGKVQRCVFGGSWLWRPQPPPGAECLGNWAVLWLLCSRCPHPGDLDPESISVARRPLGSSVLHCVISCDSLTTSRAEWHYQYFHDTGCAHRKSKAHACVPVKAATAGLCCPGQAPCHPPRAGQDLMPFNLSELVTFQNCSVPNHPAGQPGLLHWGDLHPCSVACSPPTGDPNPDPKTREREEA